MRLFTTCILIACIYSSYGMIFKQTINARAVKYEYFYNMDYKILSLPSNLYDLTINIKFIKWIGFFPLCPKSINITTLLQYGSFPLVKHDTHFQDSVVNEEKLEMSMLHSASSNESRRFYLKSPRSGPWFIASIFDNNDDYEHFIVCSAELLIVMVGSVTNPSLSVTLSPSVASLSIPLAVNNSSNLLLEIKSQQPLSRIKVRLLCPAQCDLIIATGRDTVPQIRSIAESKQQGDIYKSGDIVVDMMRPEMSLRLLLQIRTLYSLITVAKMVVHYVEVSNDRNVILMPPAANIKARMVFTYRFTSTDNELQTIPIGLSSENIVTQPFYIEPIRDQGGVLSINLIISKVATLSPALQYSNNATIYVCVSDRAFSRRQDLIEAVVTSRQCRGSHGRLQGSTFTVNHLFYYPRWGWWYVTMMVVNDSDPNTNWKANLGISSERCKKAATTCGNNGLCLLSAVDNGLVSSCHCFRPYYGLDCAIKRLPDRAEMLLAIYKRRWLLLSNLAFVPAIIVATIQKLYLLSIVYAATMALSMAYHSCSIHGVGVHICLLPIDQLTYYDHFAAAFCIWVSIVTMTTLSSRIQSILNISMVFVLMVMAHSVQRTVWMYSVPVIGGVCLIIVCWTYRMYRLKCIFPPIDWWTFGLVPGFSLIVTGFVFFRLSVYEDYQYFLCHSIWHILIALAICFILPNTSRWDKALKKSSSTNLIGGQPNIVSRRWRLFKKNVNYYLHLDVLIDYLVLHHPSCAILKSY